MFYKIKNFILNKIEDYYLVKGKTCCACEYFKWYHGSAGVCYAKPGCTCKHIKDCMDTCDKDMFKKKKKV
jgi:hypothetical protein